MPLLIFGKSILNNIMIEVLQNCEILFLDLKLNDFLNIEKNSSNVLEINQTIENSDKTTTKKAEEQIMLLSEKANKNINKREYFYYLLDRTILIIFTAIFIINIAMMFFYKRQLN